MIKRIPLLCSLVFSFFYLNLSAQTINLTSSPQYVRIGDLDISGTQITVEALVKFTGGVNIVSKHTGPANVNYLMRIGTFEITTSTQFYLMSNPYAGSMLPNTWYHVAGTYDGSFVRYYVNGCLIVQQAATGTIVQNNLITGIGNISSAPNGEQFYGEIDELRIWNIARTPAQLAANMFDLPNPTSYTNLKGYYKFDGNVLNIQGNAAYNGTWVGTPAYGTQPSPSVIPAFSVQSATPSNLSCFGANDGAIAVAATGNNLQYSINNTTWQTSSTFTGLAPGNYIAYVRTPEGCVIQNANVFIGEPAQTTASASNTGPYCPSQAIQLNGSTTSIGTATYSWTGPGGYTSSAQNPTDATLPGTYSLTVTVNGCPSPVSSTTVVIKNTPNAVAGNAGPYCSSQTIQLSGSTSATGTNTFAWTGPNGYTSSAQNPANATAGGTYNLVVTSDGCASASVSTTVVIKPTPDATASNTGAYCTGQAIQLNGATTATGTNTFAWTGPGGFTSNVQNPGNATTAGTYNLIVTSDGCASASSSTTVVVNPIPSATATNPGPFCNGQAIQLNGSSNATGTATYAWTGPNGYTSSSQNPTDATVSGTYNLTVSANGCSSSTASTVVNISVTPSATATNTGPYCAGNAIQLNGSTAATGTNTYAWTGPNGYTSSSQNPTDATVSGTYTLTVTSNGCPSLAAPTTVVIKPVPNASATNTGPYCSGQAMQLNGSSTSAGTNTYAWTGPGGFTSSVQNPGSATAAGTYTLIVTNDGCPSLPATTSIVIIPTPVGAAGNAGPYCEGESVQLSGSTAASGPNTYAWTGPDGYTSNAQNPANATAPGTYTLIVTSSGCPGLPVTTNVVIHPNPDVTASNTGPYYLGQVVQLNATTNATGNVTYSWSGPGFTSNLQNPGNAILEGVYILSVTDGNGCSASSSTIVSFSNAAYANVPNVFTPNGDGKNDLFSIQNEGIKDLNCSFFNRWGDLVYEIKTPTGTWDGKSGNQEVADGVYFYILEASDFQNKKITQRGYLHIVR